MSRLNSLVGKKLAELEAAIALYKKDGAQAAQALLDTGIGRRAMDDIRADVDGMAATHRSQLDEATDRWSADISFARLGMQLMTAFTVALLLVVWLLARRDAQQREARRRSAVDDKRRLETEVEERTAELSELSTYLQKVREDEKSKLARDIHDELGGILVSAKMDIAWVEEHMKKKDPQVSAKLERALQALDDGVQIKRRIIEELRPTLLDNLGLSAAVDWQVHEICDRAGLACTIATPGDDTAIAPRSVDRPLPDPAGSAHQHRQVREGEERQRRSRAHRRHGHAPDRGRRRGHPRGRPEQPPVARHRRNAPASARAARRIRDRAPAGRRHDDRGQCSARARSRRAVEPAIEKD